MFKCYYCFATYDNLDRHSCPASDAARQASILDELKEIKQLLKEIQKDKDCSWEKEDEKK